MKALAFFSFHLMSGLKLYVLGNCGGSPTGSTECVLLTPYYFKKQWATCLSNQYLKQYSAVRNKQHQCRFNVDFCWYQCMLELNELDQGPVYRNCSCNNEPTSPSVSPLPTISSWCYSPSGSSCNWYRECLERVHPCEGSDTGYAIEYAEKFCNLYQDHYEDFSLNGREWIDLVRKCLQVELVPLLRQWREVSCETIRDTAFASHSRCYVNPDDNFISKQSFCDLSLRDKWRVFWTIKSAFSQAFVASMKGLLETIERCVVHDALSAIDGYVRVVKFVIGYVRSGIRQKRTTNDHNDVLSLLTAKVAKELAWEKSGITWYAYSSNENETNSITINILLASKQQVDLNSPNAPTVDLYVKVLEAAKGVVDGTLHLQDIGVTFVSFNGCKDIFCNETYTNVHAFYSRACKPELRLFWFIVFPVVLLFK